jgi:putative effector of murein hydrolase LrgA (UPF0299 family)
VKTLLLFVFIAVGVALMLYFRVNEGMSWDDMSSALKHDILPRAIAILVVIGAAAYTVKFMNRRE